MCSICAEIGIKVEMCVCSEQADKRICQTCALMLFNGCSHPTCDCFGFICPFCRKTDKTTKSWMEVSPLYWKKRSEMLENKLNGCRTRS